MTSKKSGFNPWLYLALYGGGILAVSLFALAWGPDPHIARGYGWDLFALAMTYGVVITCVAAVFDAVRRIRRFDGEMDWGEAAAREPRGEVVPMRRASNPA